MAGSASERDHAFGDLSRGLGIADVAQQHGELIAAETRDRVALFRARLEPMRDDRQQLIARAVAERVVDPFEMIEIDVHERAAREPGGGRRELLREPVAEQRAIRQLGERIVVRLAIQPFVARAVRKRGAQPLGESRAVVGDRRIARPVRRDSPRSAGRASRSSSTTGQNQKNSAPASRMERRNAWRDSSMRAMVMPSGASRTVAIMAESKVTRCTGNSLGAERRHEQASVRVRGRIQQDDADAMAARQLAEFWQHDVERAVDLARGEQRAIDFAEHLERAPVALQCHRGDVEFALERREFLHGAARQRLEAALAQAREPALQGAQRRQIALADDGGTANARRW